ncbi:OmpH family outer membrane protein, partial [Pseudomonadales bacterium]|nr:OmpH family outer membrane protein [Pseudomonadales bacterium]
IKSVVRRRCVVRFNKLISLVLVLTATAFGSLSVQAEMKIAVVDVDRAVAGSEAAQKLLRQLQEEFKTDEDTIKKIQTEAAELLQKMQKDADVMSDDEKRRVQQEIESLNNDFVYQRQKLQKEVAARQGELFIGTEEKVRKAIEDLVLENDYDMILPRAAALYVGDLYDVTRKVTEKLNQAATAQ